MSVSIRPAHPVFAGEVTGIDISRPLATQQVAAVEAGMDRYAVLTFRDQPLTDDQQLEFSRNFGELEVTLAGQMAKPEDRRLGDRLELGDISNLTARNALRARDDRSRMYALPTACGTPTPRSARSARAIRCCTAGSSPAAAATPNSPTCALPTTRLTMRPRPKSRIWSPSTRLCSRASRSVFPTMPPATRSGCARYSTGW